MPGSIARLLDLVSQTTQYLIDYPLSSSQFGELEKRLQILGRSIESGDALLKQTTSQVSRALSDKIEETALSLFPFLKNPLSPDDRHVFRNMHNRQTPGSRGVVIPAGKRTFRYACHLVSNLRDVLYSNLPIPIACAGESDLQSRYRDFVAGVGYRYRDFRRTGGRR